MAPERSDAEGALLDAIEAHDAVERQLEAFRRAHKLGRLGAIDIAAYERLIAAKEWADARLHEVRRRRLIAPSPE